MCKPASFIVTKGPKAWWSEKTDSHSEIITEHKLRETDARGDINIVPVEVTPPSGNLSLPLSKWVFAVNYASYKHELPDWWDTQKAEAACRAALKEWKSCKMKGWHVKEAFAPVRPFAHDPSAMTREEVLVLVRDWASVGDSIRDSVGDSVCASVVDSVVDSVCASVGDLVVDSVWASVGDSIRDPVVDSVWASVGDSVWASVWASVRNSVWASVWGYTGSLFPCITTWEYTSRNDPWASIRKLWISGYVPSFDGKTWRVHAYKDARIVFEFTASEIKERGEG